MKTVRFAFIAPALLAAGCASYYRVTDLNNSKAWYTHGIDQSGSGAAIFTDARTGDKVTIQNSQVAKISQQEFDQAVNAPSTQPVEH